MGDTKGHTLYTKEEAVEGKFAFTTDEYDTFDICFETKIPMGELGFVCCISWGILEIDGIHPTQTWESSGGSAIHFWNSTLLDPLSVLLLAVRCMKQIVHKWCCCY